jgi:hypothetical protein
MCNRTKFLGFSGLLAAALLASACGDAIGPAHGPSLATAAGTGIFLDQQSGTLGETGVHIGKGFEVANPHLGDAIVATFFWFGSTNTITEVTDHLSDETPVGNRYTLVDYVTAGGISMATYVATNVRGFPDPSTDPSTVLDVHAIFSSPVSGGVMISAYAGVQGVSTNALGEHRWATGSASAPTAVGPGAVTAGAGALTYAVMMSDGVVGREPPEGFTIVTNMSDATMVADGEYAVQAGAGSVDPQWTWYFSSPSTWLASELTLNPAALALGFTAQPSYSLPLMTIKPAVQVTVLDGEGNPATSFSEPVTIAIGHNGGVLVPGRLSGTKTVTAVNGVATFSDLSIDQPGNGYTLVVSAAGATGAESTRFNILVP